MSVNSPSAGRVAVRISLVLSTINIGDPFPCVIKI